MTAKYVIMDEAAVEIISIADYISDVLGAPATSDAFVTEFRDALRRICLFPESRPLCCDPMLSAKGYRSFRVKGYVVLYTYIDGLVYVEHVFHQTRDYTGLV